MSHGIPYPSRPDTATRRVFTSIGSGYNIRGGPLFSHLAHTSPSLDDFDRFFRDPEVLTRLAGVMPEGCLVTFELEAEGSKRRWTVSCASGALSVVQPDGAGTDCTVRCATADLRGLLLGELDPRQGFLSGRLVVEGDVGIVLDLRRALRSAEKAG